MANAYDGLLNRARPACESQVGRNRPASCEVGANQAPNINPYNWLFSGLNAASQSAQADLSAASQYGQERSQQAMQQAQQGLTHAQAEEQARLEMARQKLAEQSRKQERQEKKEKQGAFVRLKCWLFGGEDC